MAGKRRLNIGNGESDNPMVNNKSGHSTQSSLLSLGHLVSKLHTLGCEADGMLAVPYLNLMDRVNAP